MCQVVVTNGIHFQKNFMVHVPVSSLEKKIKFKCSHMPIELSVKIYVFKQIR